MPVMTEEDLMLLGKWIVMNLSQKSSIKMCVFIINAKNLPGGRDCTGGSAFDNQVSRN